MLLVLLFHQALVHTLIKNDSSIYLMNTSGMIYLERAKEKKKRKKMVYPVAP